jgi:hypothetical protein
MLSSTEPLCHDVSILAVVVEHVREKSSAKKPISNKLREIDVMR